MGIGRQIGGMPRLIEPGCFVVLNAVFGHDALHQRDELGSLLVIQPRERRIMCTARSTFNFSEQRRTGLGQPAETRPAVGGVDRPFDQLPCLQPLQRPCRGGAVQRDIGRKAGLVGGFASRQCREQAVLKWGDLETAAGVLEQGHMDLVQASNQKTRPFRQRPGAEGIVVTTSLRLPQAMLSKLDLALQVARFVPTGYLQTVA